MEKKPRIARIAIVVLILIAIITIIIIATTGKGNNPKEETNGLLTESEFDNMKVKEVKISYDEESGKTNLSYTIQNISEQDINSETVNVMLLDKNDVELTGIQTYIQYIEAKGEFKGTVPLQGNFVSAKKIDLQRPEVSE